MSTIKNRPTTELVTPSEHKVVVYEYITGGEMRQFQAQFLRGLKANELGITPESEGEEDALRGIDATQLLDAQNLLAELLVVSVDGDKELSIMDLRPVDTEFVIKALDALAKPDASKKKSDKA